MSIDLENMSDEDFDVFMNKAENDPTFDSDGEEEDLTVDNLDGNDEEKEDDQEIDPDNDEEADEDEDELDLDLEQPDNTDDDGEEKDSDEDDDELTGEQADEDPDDESEDEDESDGSDDDSDDEEEGQSEEDTTTVIPKSETKESLHKVKANGKDYELTQEEVLTLAPKALNYTQKMQEIKPYREMIDTIREQNLTQDDLNLMLDVLKGDKDAITSIVKKAGIDTMELDTEAELTYTPKNYGKTSKELDIAEIEQRISVDPEFKVTANVVNKLWDSKSREILLDNPGAVEGLHEDVKSGLFDEASAIAFKLKALDGATKSDLDYYIEAGQKVKANREATEKREADKVAEEEARADERKVIEKAKAKAKRQSATKKSANKRKAAAPTKKAGKPTVSDYLDDDASDEEFANLMEKLI